MSVFPLNHFPSGSKVTIASCHGGNGARSRLYALGLTPGTQVFVASSGGGPCRMKVRNSELVIGQGMAEKILAFSSD